MLRVDLFPVLLLSDVVVGFGVDSASSHLGVGVGWFEMFVFVEVWYCFVIVSQVW